MPRTPPGTRQDYRAFSTHHTRWHDADVYGHLNNVVYQELIDTAVNRWLIGQGLLDPAAGRQIGLMVESGCRFYAEARFPQTVTAGLRVAHVGNSSVRYEVGLFAGESDTASAEGFFVHVYVDRDTRRPLPLPQDFRDGLASLTPDPSKS